MTTYLTLMVLFTFLSSPFIALGFLLMRSEPTPILLFPHDINDTWNRIHYYRANGEFGWEYLKVECVWEHIDTGVTLHDKPECDIWQCALLEDTVCIPHILNPDGTCELCYERTREGTA